jgi:predicted CXXCH cytochrome family protein
LPSPTTTRRIAGFTSLALALFVATSEIIPHRPEQPTVVSASEIQSKPALNNPDAVCASCHRDIYDKYQQTSMARGSGGATEGLLPGQFHHAPSDVDYKVFARNGTDWMSYSRPASDPKGVLDGERQLQYYIGSGHRGRTYLYNEDGRWYEIPINFYTRRKAWDMAPAFDNATTMPAPLPTDPNCLHCHTTEVQPALQDARNHFAAAPFRQGGIGCSACHGNPQQHLALKGYGPITNPGKLPVAQRDSACIQCHLEGDAVVYRAGRSLAQFVAGDKLDDIAVYFVRATDPRSGIRGTSQYEALLRSACKRAAGDKLTCTTCHDPHFQPLPEQRVQYFRARCLACHTSPAMASHHPEQPDCATCHMPTRNTADISHEQVTDHDIEARPVSHSRSGGDENVRLIPVGNFTAGDRELGLAYAQFAQRGDRQAGETALHLLSKLAPTTPADVDVLVRLGYLQQVSGDLAKARLSYMAALNVNPWEPTALANLAVLDAGTGHVSEAVSLLQKLVDADPSQSAAGLNLAYIQCKLDHKDEARSLLNRLLQSNPDDPQLRHFAGSGDYSGGHCDLRSVASAK